MFMFNISRDTKLCTRYCKVVSAWVRVDIVDLPCSSHFVMFFIYVKTPVKSLSVTRLRNSSLYTNLILTTRITVKGKGKVQRGLGVTLLFL